MTNNPNWQSNMDFEPPPHEKLIECHPKLARRQVWCLSCGSTRRVENGLRDGWPKCCDATMTLDAPGDRP